MMLYRSIFFLGCFVSLGIEATLLVTQWLVPTLPLTDTITSVPNEEESLMIESRRPSLQSLAISQFYPEQTEPCTTVVDPAAHPDGYRTNGYRRRLEHCP